MIVVVKNDCLAAYTYAATRYHKVPCIVLYTCTGKTKPLHLSVAERRNLHTAVYADDALRVSAQILYSVCDILWLEMPQAAYR